MINWNNVLSDTPFSVDVFRGFARGIVPKNTLLEVIAYSRSSGQIRNAIRERGTKRVRDASRRSLQRRNLL